ncbi:hypothetical protein, partial [Novosphingobium sp.]|uniref:hypothetical protein n=1 Tax=Novosphingobium sp. TaxID=1874826 RepID=UPI002FD9B375
ENGRNIRGSNQYERNNQRRQQQAAAPQKAYSGIGPKAEIPSGIDAMCQAGPQSPTPISAAEYAVRASASTPPFAGLRGMSKVSVSQ